MWQFQNMKILHVPLKSKAFQNRLSTLVTLFPSTSPVESNGTYLGHLDPGFAHTHI